MSKLISGAQGEWCHPIQTSMPVYNQPSTNVFLQLQNKPVPSASEDDDTPELPLIQAIGTPDDTPLYTIDSSYLQFFVLELPSILAVDHLFSNAMGRILGMTIGNPASGIQSLPCHLSSPTKSSDVQLHERTSIYRKPFLSFNPRSRT